MKNKYIAAARVVHWSKNLIIFIPALMAHELKLLTHLTNTIVIFLSMSLFASAGYLFNDYFDKEDDRINAYKKKRAYASGDISKNELFGLSIVFLLLGLVLSWSISWATTALLLIYLLISILYSSILKKFFIIDILLITFFFLFRLFIGHEVFGVAYSSWLFAFAFFFFFGLASVKRVSELQSAVDRENPKLASRRAYTLSDLPLIVIFGVTSGFIAILILILYIQSPAALKLYMNAEILWLLCPILLYWLYRLWLLSYRAAIRKDPMSFILSDPVSYMCLFLLSVILYSAT